MPCIIHSWSNCRRTCRTLPCSVSTTRSTPYWHTFHSIRFDISRLSAFIDSFWSLVFTTVRIQRRKGSCWASYRWCDGWFWGTQNRSRRTGVFWYGGCYWSVQKFHFTTVATGVSICSHVLPIWSGSDSNLWTYERRDIDGMATHEMFSIWRKGVWSSKMASCVLYIQFVLIINSLFCSKIVDAHSFVPSFLIETDEAITDLEKDDE